MTVAFPEIRLRNKKIHAKNGSKSWAPDNTILFFKISLPQSGPERVTPMKFLLLSLISISSIMPRNILDFAEKHKVKRVIFISSTAVYGIPKKLSLSLFMAAVEWAKHF